MQISDIPGNDEHIQITAKASLRDVELTDASTTIAAHCPEHLADAVGAAIGDAVSAGRHKLAELAEAYRRLCSPER